MSDKNWDGLFNTDKLNEQSGFDGYSEKDCLDSPFGTSGN